MRAIVNVPHGLFERAFTTARPRPASATIMIKSIANAAANPPTGPISSRAICARERPFLLTEANNITMSCTAPPSAEPISIHKNPGRYPNCAASIGPINGPAPAMAAK